MLILADLTKEMLEHDYQVELLTQKEIAWKYNTSETKVWSLMQKWNIPRIFNRQYLRRGALSLTSLQKELLVGTLCGDGTINKDPSGSCLFYVSHSTNQLDLLTWKADLLQDWIPPTYHYKVIEEGYRSEKDPEKKFYRVEFHTMVAPVFTELYYLFYGTGKKEITSTILDQMTPLSLAVWFMDDGGYSTNSLDINGHWSDTTKALIIDWFKNRWNIDIKIRDYKHNSGTDRITFSVTESVKFASLIFEHVIPSMRYKFKYIKIPPSETIRQAPIDIG